MANQRPRTKPSEEANPLDHVTPWGDVLRWRLPALMAAAGFRFATQLHEALKGEAIELSYSHVHRLTQNAPERLTVDVQFALCRILNCGPADLWQQREADATANAPATPAKARQKLKTIKPVRARGLG